MIIDIVRFYETDTETRGILLINNESTNIYTLELPYINNMQNISCIPCGEYSGNISKSNKFGPVIRLENVPERTNILIHPGNTVLHTKGCILLGDRIGMVDGKTWITNSAKTLKKLIDIINEFGNKGFKIRIQRVA